MSGAVVLIVIGLGFVAVLAVQALTRSATGHAFDVAGRAYEKRRKPSVALTTSLSTEEALRTARDVARQLDPDAAIQVSATVDREGRTRVELRSGSAATGSDQFKRFQGALLAALRQRDDTTRQAGR